MPLTSLTGSGPVASSCAVTDKPVPALFADTVVTAGVAVTLLAAHFAAQRLNPSSVLGLRDLTDVLAAAINK